MGYEPIFKPFTSRPPTQNIKNPLYSFHALLRDNFTIPTWLLFGALIQGLATLCLPYRNLVLVLPALLAVCYKLTLTILMTFSLIHNPHMDNVRAFRTSPILPNPKTGAQDEPSSQTVCAIILAVRSNHPLGIFAPYYKEVGDSFTAMIQELSASATESGFLGASSWLSQADRMTSSENMQIVYFESLEAMHSYAHGPLHTRTMQWWHALGEKVRHVGIMHEVFVAPKGNWEGVYLSYHPTGLGATSKEAVVNGQRVWINPLVKSKGKLPYSKGRMGKAVADDEWDAFDTVLTAEEKMA